MPLLHQLNRLQKTRIRGIGRLKLQREALEFVQVDACKRLPRLRYGIEQQAEDEFGSHQPSDEFGFFGFHDRSFRVSEGERHIVSLRGGAMIATMFEAHRTPV